MKAQRIHRFGGPEVITLDDVDVPTPGQGEIVVRVQAAGVGPWDALVRTGKSALSGPPPLTLGADLSGVVAAVGPGVGSFAIGDELFGATSLRFVGAYAEYAVAQANMMAPRPRMLTPIEAAGVPVVAVTAWQMLFEHAHLIVGQTVLVLGAAGSVGSYAVQLAHLHGLRVVAAAAPADAEALRQLGAERVVDARSTAFDGLAGQVEAVLDTVGGALQRRALALLAPGGVLVSVVAPPDAAETARQGVRGDYFIVSVNRRVLDELARFFESGQLRARTGVVLPLAEAQQAHEMLDGTRPHPRGKIILEVARG